MSQIVISVQVVRNILAVINLRFNIQKLTDEIDFVWMDVVMKKKVSYISSRKGRVSRSLSKHYRKIFKRRTKFNHHGS